MVKHVQFSNDTKYVEEPKQRPLISKYILSWVYVTNLLYKNNEFKVWIHTFLAVWYFFSIILQIRAISRAILITKSSTNKKLDLGVRLRLK